MSGGARGGHRSRVPLSPREAWLSDGRQVLHFRPTVWDRWNQRLEITSGELLPDQPVPLRRRWWEPGRKQVKYTHGQNNRAQAMESALRLFSWYGFKQEIIRARDIRSREDARKLGPFVDSTGTRFVHWRRPSFEAGTRQCIRSSHFAHYPNASGNRSLDSEFLLHNTCSIAETYSRDPRHGLAIEAIAKALKGLLAKGEEAPWAYIDHRVSGDAPFAGNLLQDVTEIRTEYQYRITTIDQPYRFDIALLGPQIGRDKAILAVIEVELTHSYDFYKCLMAKSLGFPMLSVDISEASIEDITEGWARGILLGSTASRADGRRFNYVYLHDMIAPVFLDADFSDKHAYIVFVGDGKHDLARRKLKWLKEVLGFSPDDRAILVQTVGIKNDQDRKVAENEGSLAGKDWAAFNSDCYLRIVLQRPRPKLGPLYIYHLQMAMLLNGHLNCLVGYKFRNGLKNTNPEEPFWEITGVGNRPLCRLPKQVSQPLRYIRDEIRKISR